MVTERERDAVFVMLPASALARTPKTFVTYDCVHQAMQPSSIMFGCDGSYTADHLSWSIWWPRHAHATGVFHIDDCIPNCAHGTFHKRGGSVNLTGRQWCATKHKFLFKQATVVYDQPYQGHSKSTFYAFDCPPT
jgi:hypothetical protein